MPRIKTERDLAVDRVRDLVEYFTTQAKAAVQAAYLRCEGPHPGDANPMDDEIDRLLAEFRAGIDVLDDDSVLSSTIAHRLAGGVAYLALRDKHSRFCIDATPADVSDGPEADGLGGVE